MDPSNWQEMIALSLVAIAGAYLVLRAVTIFTRRKSAACGGGCQKCFHATQAPPSSGPTVVSVEQLASSAKQLRTGDWMTHEQ